MVPVGPVVALVAVGPGDDEPSILESLELDAHGIGRLPEFIRQRTQVRRRFAVGEELVQQADAGAGYNKCREH